MTDYIFTDEDELLKRASDADVVMWGEHHQGDSSFRKLFCRSLPKLQLKGFTALALELRDKHSPALRSYCNGKISYAELASEFLRISVAGSQIGCFDEPLLSAVKEWFKQGGRLLLINTLDPRGKNLSNARGRDQRMSDRISKSLARGKCLVLVGSGHTFIRDRVRLESDSWFGVIKLDLQAELARGNPEGLGEDELSMLWQQALSLTFMSAAEKITAGGKSCFCIADVRHDELLRGQEYPEGLILKQHLGDLAEMTFPEVRAGGGVKELAHLGFKSPSQLAPELIHQVFFNRLDQWDCVFFSNDPLPNSEEPLHGFRESPN